MWQIVMFLYDKCLSLGDERAISISITQYYMHQAYYLFTLKAFLKWYGTGTAAVIGCKQQFPGSIGHKDTILLVKF